MRLDHDELDVLGLTGGDASLFSFVELRFQLHLEGSRGRSGSLAPTPLEHETMH